VLTNILSSRQVRANMRENATIVQSLILPTQENKAKEDEDKAHEELSTLINESIEHKYQQLLNDHEKLKTKYKHLSQFNRFQKNRINTLNKKCNFLSQKFGEQASQTHILNESLKIVFSQTQLQLITKKKKKGF